MMRYAACAATLFACVASTAFAQAPANPPTTLPAQAPLPPEPQAKASAKAEAEGKQETALVLACKERALVVLKQRSPSIEDITIDMDGLTVAKADLSVEDTKVNTVIMGEAYIQRDKTDKVHRFLCLTGEGGKVLMTFFTER